MMQAFQHHSRVRLGLLGIDMTAAVDPRHLSLRLRIESFSSPVGVDHLRWNGQMGSMDAKFKLYKSNLRDPSFHSGSLLIWLSSSKSWRLLSVAPRTLVS
jgi:hypothetical protein